MLASPETTMPEGQDAQLATAQPDGCVHDSPGACSDPACLLLMCCASIVQVRAPTHIVSTICDDRGEEPTYHGVTMSELIEVSWQHA